MLIGRRVVGTVGVMGGVPAVYTEFAWALMQFAQLNERFVQGPTEEILYLLTRQSYHASARNELAARMEGDWLFMLDTDQTFAPSVLQRLLRPFQEHDLDIITGLYYQKGPPYLPVLFRWLLPQPLTPSPAGRGGRDGGAQFISGFNDDTLLKVDAAGAGCLLVRRRVFDRIALELGEEPFTPFDGYSEDLSFFKRCQRLGIEAWCHPAVEMEHLRTAAVTRQDHNQAAGELGGEEYEVEALTPSAAEASERSACAMTAALCIVDTGNRQWGKG